VHEEVLIFARLYTPGKQQNTGKNPSCRDSQNQNRPPQTLPNFGSGSSGRIATHAATLRVSSQRKTQHQNQRKAAKKSHH
jgi:hypothetical protein